MGKGSGAASRERRTRHQSTSPDANTRLQTLIQAIPDMILFKDAQGRHLIVNRAVEEMTGHGRDEFRRSPTT